MGQQAFNRLTDANSAEWISNLDLAKVVSIIEGILMDPVLLSNVAKNSYAHSNGFDKIPIYVSSQGGLKIRLHIWWPLLLEQSSSKEDVHNHRWDFGSKILTGELMLENWVELQERHEGSVHKEEYLYRPRGTQEYFSMEHKGAKKLLKTFSCILNAGSSYTISHEQLHRALNNNCLLTSTIMIQEPAKRETTRVFTEGLIESARRIESPHFSEQELSQRLRRYLKSVR